MANGFERIVIKFEWVGPKRESKELWVFVWTQPSKGKHVKIRVPIREIWGVFWDVLGCWSALNPLNTPLCNCSGNATLFQFRLGVTGEEFSFLFKGFFAAYKLTAQNFLWNGIVPRRRNLAWKIHHYIQMNSGLAPRPVKNWSIKGFLLCKSSNFSYSPYSNPQQVAKMRSLRRNRKKYQREIGKLDS